MMLQPTEINHQHRDQEHYVLLLLGTAYLFGDPINHAPIRYKK